MVSCQKKDYSTDKSYQSVIGKTFLKLEKENNKFVIFQPCDAVIPKYIVYKDSIFHHWGQEFYTFKISSIKKIDKKFIYEGQYEFEQKTIEKGTILFRCLDEKKGLWNINNEVFVDEKYRSNFPRKNEDCLNGESLPDENNGFINEDQKLYLFGNKFLETINSKNVSSKDIIGNIEFSIKDYSSQKDFGTNVFFDRESKRISKNLDSEQMKIWKTCNQYLDFSDVCSENSLESNWRYPYDKIKSVSTIYNLYKNKSYEEGFESETLKYNIALYMYFLSWSERKKVYEEIINIKKDLSKSYLGFNGVYLLKIPSGVVREDSPELEIRFKIENNRNVTIETFINKKITDKIKAEGSINNNEFRISYLKDGQQEEYIIKKLDNNYNISGSSIGALNPFTKQMDIVKL